MPRKSAAKKKQAKQSLFGFDDDDDAGPEGQHSLRVNESFARRFEHNKKREELHRLKEKFPEQARRLEERGIGALLDDQSSSSSEDEDDGYVSQKTERQILETILKIRNKDSSIYNPEARFYSDDEEKSEDEADQGKKRDKPVYLKDVMYKEAMEVAERGGYDDEDKDDRGYRERGEAGRGKSYVEEQADLKKAFLTAFDEDVEGEGRRDGGDGGDGQKAENGEDVFGGVLKKSGRVREEAEVTDAETQRLVDQIFSKGAAGNSKGNGPVEGDRQEAMTANDRFLRDYILKQAWMKGSDDEYDDPDLDGGDGEGMDGEQEEDEEAYEAAENFEANYNFRFEEPGGAEIATYPRTIEGTVRKKDDRRAQKRQEKAARKAAEEEERRRELKQLKNLKKMEIENKLKEIKNIAGSGAAEEDLIGKLLDGEFDPEAHDKAMAEAFGEDYYEQGDEEEDLEDEEFDRKLAAMAAYSSDEETHPDTIAAMLAKRTGKGDNDGASNLDDKYVEDEDEKQDPEAAKEDVKKLLDEYYKLDYEDYVGGVPTRFKYKQVEPETFGLSFEDILMMDDKELNQVIGMKRVAATYYDGPNRRPNYGKLNELRRSAEEKYAGMDRKGKHKRDSKEKKDKKEKAKRKDKQHKDQKRRDPTDAEPFTREAELATNGDGDGDGKGWEDTHQAERAHSAPRQAPQEKKRSETERRLDTFKKPTLKNRPRNEDGNTHREKKRAKKTAEPAPSNPDTAGLTKAQRRNRRRALQRAQRASEGGA